MDEQGQILNDASVDLMAQLSPSPDPSIHFFKSAFENYLPGETVSELLYYHQAFMSSLAESSEKPEKKLTLQTQYWQELYLLWQRFMSHFNEAALQIFVKDYLRLHLQYLQNLALQGDNPRLEAYLKPLLKALA